MQSFSAFLGFFSLILVLGMVRTIFSKNFKGKSKFYAVFIMAVLAVALFGIKTAIIDNKAEVYDLDYRQVYIAVDQMNNEEFRSFVASKMQDGKLSKNELKEIRANADIDFFELNPNKPLNINNQSITPIQLEPLQKTAVGLSAGLGSDILYMGIIIATMLIAAGLLRFKAIPQEIKDKEQLEPKEIFKAMRLEFSPKFKTPFLIVGVLIGGVASVILMLQSDEGSNYKKEIDQFFEANSHIQAVQDFKAEIYANGKISAKELQQIVTLPESLEKADIIQALK